VSISKYAPTLKRKMTVSALSVSARMMLATVAVATSVSVETSFLRIALYAPLKYA